jgi:glycosyltransferase involved in cell wall biosynthesis
MKILIATPLLPPDSGGPAREAAMLLDGLPRLGLETVVYSFGEVRHLPKGIRHIKYFFGLLSRMKNVTQIIAIDTFSVCLPAALVSKFTGTDLVVRVPGDFVWEQSTQRFGVTDTIEEFQKRKYGLKVEIFRRIQKWSVSRASVVVVPSDFFKRIVEKWGIPSDRIRKIYLGIDKLEEAKLPSPTPQGCTIISAGRFVPWKGFSMLIDLLDQLPREWNLVLIGDGPDKKDLVKKVHALGLESRTRFTGSIEHSELLGWLKTGSVFVLNTSFESFSFQILEAMMSGIPVVSTRVGSIPELIREGIDGVLCLPDNIDEFKEAVLSTKEQPGMWRERTTSASLRASEFSAEASLSQFSELLINSTI